MFQITEYTEVTLATFTKREETHGDEKVAAISVTLELTGANTLLDAIDPSIRHSLYKAVEGQDPLPVAYRHMHDDGWEYYDSPTGEDCAGCEALFSADQLRAAIAAERERAGSVDARVVEDAERYRWLRDVSVPPHNFYLSVPVEFAGVKYTPQEVDAAIDAARSKP